MNKLEPIIRAYKGFTGQDIVGECIDGSAPCGQPWSAVFLHQSQICMSANRIIVADIPPDKFLDVFSEAVRSIKVGDPSAPRAMIGSLCSAQAPSVSRLVESGREAGFNVWAEGDIQGRVVPPHVFSNVENSSDLAQSEIFESLTIVMRGRDETEALPLGASCLSARQTVPGEP